MFSFEFVHVRGSVLFRQSPRCKPVWREVNSSSRSVIFCDSISGHVACNLFFLCFCFLRHDVGVSDSAEVPGGRRHLKKSPIKIRECVQCNVLTDGSVFLFQPYLKVA